MVSGGGEVLDGQVGVSHLIDTQITIHACTHLLMTLMKKLYTDQAGAGQPVSCLGLVWSAPVHCLFIVLFVIGMLCRQCFDKEVYTSADAMQANHMMECAERTSQAATDYSIW